MVSQVAFCADYSLVQISAVGGGAAARIPLFYRNSTDNFIETGSFFVVLEINIDAVTRFVVTLEDRVFVSFVNGNASLDITYLPEYIIPYLTITGLPFYTTKNHISNIYVYNLNGSVASSGNPNNIIVTRGESYTTLQIPLLSNGDYFRDTGSFLITFSVNTDYITHFSVRRDDNVILQFTAGSALYDVLSFGYFSAELVNPNDTAAPVIKKGSAFDVDGFIFRAQEDIIIPALYPPSSCVLYLYAFRFNNDINFEFSSVAPVYNSAKRGYYLDTKRALWKMFFLVSNGNHFLFKTYIADDWPHLEKFVIPNTAPVISSASSVFSLSGAANPQAAAFNLPQGIYVAEVKGAGGGGGYGFVEAGTVTGSSSGGAGGSVTEIFTVNSDTTFTAYTGSGGFAAPAPVPSGNFGLYKYHLVTVGAGSHLYSFATKTAPSGGGGGGGGSGSFISTDGYFLCAGGGGGGSGGSNITPGGAGGAGGSIGSGGGGGAAGYLRQTYDSNNKTFTTSGNGGNGGGLNGGNSGLSAEAASNRNGSNGSSLISPRLFSFSGTGRSFNFTVDSLHSRPNINITYEFSSSAGDGGDAAHTYNSANEFMTFLPEWLYTNNANGQGANAPDLNTVKTITYGDNTNIITEEIIDPGFNGLNGQAGGNNRDSSRGGGGSGGAVSNSLPSNGSAGSITIYRLF